MLSNDKHEKYMALAIELAKQSGREVKSNPKVGSVLVSSDKVIGTGYYQKFGGLHAERNAILEALKNNSSLVQGSTLYVTLEPCCIHRKTPPCTDFIIQHGIKTVVIGCLDPNPEVNKIGVNQLKSSGIEVIENVLATECAELIRSFQANLKKRPYVILKWAQSKDFFIGQRDKTVWLSNSYSQIANHKWRTEVDAIMIGTETVILDNPKLNVRHYSGTDPLRILLDRNNRVPNSHHLKADGDHAMILSNTAIPNLSDNKEIYQLDSFEPEYVLKFLFNKGVCTLIIEGGKRVLESYIKSNLWDEARIITTNKDIHDGVPAPTLKGKIVEKWQLYSDYITKIINISESKS